MNLTESLKSMLAKTAKNLKNSARRIFMAETVKELGKGGQRLAEKELGWSRITIRKGIKELTSGVNCIDAFNLRGRKATQEKYPNLSSDIKSLIDPQSQTDPKFRSKRLYTRLSAKEVRYQLIIQKGYQDPDLPSKETIRQQMNQLGYFLKKVSKTKPLKKIPETDKIFKEVHRINHWADNTKQVLRISMDAKATVNIGLFSRGGKSRIKVAAVDHDFKPTAKVTPVGIFLPEFDEIFLYPVTSKVTSDCLVDCLILFWERVKERFPHITTVVINLDNGPENNSHRTQFMNRIVEFAHKYGLIVRLAYYPPYHSKYNPVERVWGILENHWNGTLLDSIDTVVRFAQSMTWNGKLPVVQLVDKIYQTGVGLTKKAMNKIEIQIQRFPSLGKWFVDIFPPEFWRIHPLLN